MPRPVGVEDDDGDGGGVTVGEWKRIHVDYWSRGSPTPISS